MSEITKQKLSRKEQRELAQKRLRETGKICEKTNVAAKKGQDSLQEINDRVSAAENVSDIFMDMKTLMTSVASAKGYIKKGQSKIRQGGSPDDFLNFVTIKMCERWQKQKSDDLINGPVGKTRIENWCAYANITMFNHLIEYNRSILDFDYEQMPTQVDKDGDITEIEIENPKEFSVLSNIILKEKLTPEHILHVIETFPSDLREFMPDAIFYLIYNRFMDSERRDFTIIAVRLLRRALFNGRI